MSIEVRCPNGHLLKVKDKYGGKTGVCPFCKGRVLVSVPKKLSEEDIVDLISAPSSRASEEDDASSATGEEGDAKSVPSETADSESILDDAHEESSGISIVGASAIRHRTECPKCNEQIPYWFAKCPKCGTYLPDSKT